jgi:hypothetical protein
MSVHAEVSHGSGTSGQKKLRSPGPVEWLVRNPTVTLLDFYLWGHLKTLVYVEKMKSAAHLWELIADTCNTLTLDTNCLVIANWIPLLHLCIHHNGGHTDHIL